MISYLYLIASEVYTQTVTLVFGIYANLPSIVPNLVDQSKESHPSDVKSLFGLGEAQSALKYATKHDRYLGFGQVLHPLRHDVYPKNAERIRWHLCLTSGLIEDHAAGLAVLIDMYQPFWNEFHENPQRN